MTTGSLILVQAVFITLFISLVSPAVWSQQQVQPNEPSQEKAAGEPSQPASAPTTTTLEQQGAVINQEQSKQTPEKAKEAPQQKAPTEGESYTIKQGDTLWDISNTFLKDPFLWPFVWKANPSIANPDLIYPGNKLAIPSLAPIERALQAQPAPKEQLVEKQKEELVEKTTTTVQAPAAEKQPQPVEEAKAPVSKFVLPEQTAQPVVDKYTMLNAGFVNTEENKGVIVGSRESKTIFGYDDIVYVTIKSEDAAVGDRFIIYRVLKKVKHPDTREEYGKLVKILGVLRLTEKGEAPGTYGARITLSFDAAEKGSLLTPYQEPTLVLNTVKEKPKDITGIILEVMDGRTINAQTDIVYLDKGSSDGVDPGDRFLVYARPQKQTYPKEVLGEVQVFLVKERTATAVVTKSVNFMARGDKVEYKKPVSSAVSEPAK